MTKRKKAEQVFRRLSVENRGLLLTYFETAMEAENSVKKSLDSAAAAGWNPGDLGGEAYRRGCRREECKEKAVTERTEGRKKTGFPAF
jgi:hypothetical protein